jgi:type IV pilus assembly protein PilB
MPTGAAVLLRVDGVLRVDRRMEAPAFTELVSAVKVMAGLDIAERRVPQDGQFEAESAGERISLRVATMPVIHGEKATLRLLPTEGDQTLASLDSLGMNPRHHELFQQALDLSDGILLLTGPTGSGKTTTLYAALRRLAAPGDRHILSIEDPVEIPIPGVNQVRVRHGEGLTGFHTALRSALRHDPDIIMIGEIRDAETADIAVKAAMTGHLVLSTLHTNDAVGVITRLENLGVPPYLVASTLRLAAAQRLVRTPCAHCVADAAPSAGQRERLGLDGDETVATVTGCALCGHTGYAGRTGLFELVAVDDDVGEMILAGESESALRQHVFAGGENPTLLDDGRDKIRRHITTPGEVLRVVLTGI